MRPWQFKINAGRNNQYWNEVFRVEMRNKTRFIRNVFATDRFLCPTNVHNAYDNHADDDYTNDKTKDDTENKTENYTND